MITSSSNTQIKSIVKLMKSGKERKEQGVYPVEGIRMFREIPENLLEKFYITEACAEELRELQQKLNGKQRDCSAVCRWWRDSWQENVHYEYVSDSVMKIMSDTQTPQGVIAIVKQKIYTREEIVRDMERSSRCILLLEHLQDPGNLGTILRTAEGAGVSGILMSSDTADIYNPKVVRATMGSIFRVPHLYVENLPDTVEWLKAKGIQCCAAHLNGTEFYQVDYTTATCFFIGNEGNGLTDTLTELADHKIRIPMAGQVESLNAATAATVLMYEAFRQNRV